MPEAEILSLEDAQQDGTLQVLHGLAVQQGLLKGEDTEWAKISADVDGLTRLGKAIVNGVTRGQIAQEHLGAEDSKVDELSDVTAGRLAAILRGSSDTVKNIEGDKPGKYNNWRVIEGSDGNQLVLTELKPGVVFTARIDLPENVPAENVRKKFEEGNGLESALKEAGFTQGDKDTPGAIYIDARTMTVDDAKGDPVLVVAHSLLHQNPSKEGVPYADGGAYSIGDTLTTFEKGQF